MFVIGAVPAVLALVVRWRLREPERWQQAAHEGDVARKLGSYRELFGHPTWRQNALVGLGWHSRASSACGASASSRSILSANVFRDRFVAEGMPDDRVVAEVAQWKGSRRSR